MTRQSMALSDAAAPVVICAVPSEGEALLSAKTCAAVAGVNESTWWAWVAEPGAYVVHAAASSRDLRLSTTVVLD